MTKLKKSYSQIKFNNTFLYEHILRSFSLRYRVLKSSNKCYRFLEISSKQINISKQNSVCTNMNKATFDVEKSHFIPNQWPRYDEWYTAY